MYEEKVRKFKCYHCPDCNLYAGSETKTIHGRRMKPNTKYCTGGQKVIIFRSDDPKVTVPKWCPNETFRTSASAAASVNRGTARSLSYFPSTESESRRFGSNPFARSTTICCVRFLSFRSFNRRGPKSYNISVLPSLHNINILQFGAVLIMESA